MDDFTTLDLPELSGGAGGARRPEGIVSSLVWNAPQVRRRAAAGGDSVRRSHMCIRNRGLHC